MGVTAHNKIDCIHMTAPALSLERIYPKQMDSNDPNDKDSLDIHFSRYEFASTQLTGNNILDMACGCGFGTALMATANPDKQFTGIDIDPAAVEYARTNYKLDNLRYECSDALQWSGDSYDSIVSLETIEHLPSPQKLAENLTKLLKQGGRIIASVPVTPTCDGNPHHLHDFTKASFKRLFLDVGFEMGDEFSQVQKWEFNGLFSKSEVKEHRSEGVGNNVLAYYKKHPSALLARLLSIVTNGLCNIYLTAVFTRK